MSADFTVFVDVREFKMSWLFDEKFVKLNPPFDNNCLTLLTHLLPSLCLKASQVSHTNKSRSFERT